MLSAAAIGKATGTVNDIRLLQAGPRSHLRRDPHALRDGPTRRAVTVADELRRAGCSRPSGVRRPGPDPRFHPGHDEAGRYAGIVEEYALLRRLIGVAGEIAELGYSVPEDVQKALDRAESLVYEVNERRVTDSMKPLSALLSENLDHIEALHERGSAITGTPTGYLDLDMLLSGLQPSSLVVVGARPAMGKTSFALGMLAHPGSRRPTRSRASSSRSR